MIMIVINLLDVRASEVLAYFQGHGRPRVRVVHWDHVAVAYPVKAVFSITALYIGQTKQAYE